MSKQRRQKEEQDPRDQNRGGIIQEEYREKA